MLQFIIAGLVLGSIYALAASGLVITYVSTGILNFAFGSLAFFIARLYYHLNVEKDWETLPAAVVCLLVVAPLLGLFLYVAIFRFLRLSSQLIKVVVTIGLAVTIPPIAEVIFGSGEIFLAPGLAPQPVAVYTWFDVAVTLDQVITYASVIAIVVIGALVLRFTEVGLSVRAMVDSEAMTSLSGSSPTKIAAGVWVVATFLAGLAGVLAAPVIGLNAGRFTLLTAAAFAAVIAARLRSLPIAVAVALLMGVVTAVVEYILPPDSEFLANVRPSIPFAFVVISLVYNTVRSGSVNEDEGVGGALDRAILPHGGTRLATSANVDTSFPRLNFLFPVVVFAIVCIFPLFLKPYWLGLLSQAATLAVIFLAYTLVTGEGGMLWLCQITFAGIGAISTAQFATEAGWPWILSVIAGGVVAAVIGVVLGLLTIRLGNLYVALVTLTFGLLMETIVFTRDTFAQSGAGVPIDRPDFATSEQAFVYVTLGVFAVLAALVVNLRRSSTGLAMNAVRWSETASRTMGLSVLQMKVLISALAAFVAGVGGGLFATQQRQALPTGFATLLGLGWLAVLVTFGVRSNIAALLAAISFVIFPALFNTYLTATWAKVPLLLFGVGAILLAKNPDGTVHLQARQFQQLLRRLGGARGSRCDRDRGSARSSSDRTRGPGRSALALRLRGRSRGAGGCLGAHDVTSATHLARAGGTPEVTMALEAKGVTVRFGGLVALSDVDISVPPAAIVGLVGPNGAGKTTLFHVVSGLLRPQEGEVYLGGRRITRASPTRRARLGLARTFQQLELFMGLTVREHVLLGYRVRNERRRLWSDLFTAGALHRESPEERDRVDHLVDLLGLTSVARVPATALPLGTSRRVEVARALSTSPSVVLLDEPSSGLDAHETAQLGAALRSVVQEEQVSMLLVEHDVAMVLGLSSSVSVLDFGVKIADGTPNEIRADPAVRAAYLGDDEAVEGTS